MYMRPCGTSCRTDFGNGLAARNPITHLDEILFVVCIQHLMAVFGLNDDRITVATFVSAFDHTSTRYGMYRGPCWSCNVGPGVIPSLAIYGIAPPSFGRADDTAYRQIQLLNCRLRH